MNEIVVKYHPVFVQDSELQIRGLVYPDMFNVERLVEESMAHVSGIQILGQSYSDYSDWSDCKTASIRLTPSSPGANTYRGEISGVTRPSGGGKIGALRCTIYNPHRERIRYYYLPKSMWQECITVHPTSGIGKIRYTYNSTTDCIGRFRDYECGSFIELALAKSS